VQTADTASDSGRPLRPMKLGGAILFSSSSLSLSFFSPRLITIIV
jgi:hypothetical protein